MRRMPEFDEILNGLVLELRRGTIVLSVLSQLEQPEYGYSLVQILEEKGMPVDAGTLYPLPVSYTHLLRKKHKQAPGRAGRLFVISSYFQHSCADPPACGPQSRFV